MQFVVNLFQLSDCYILHAKHVAVYDGKWLVSYLSLATKRGVVLSRTSQRPTIFWSWITQRYGYLLLSGGEAEGGIAIMLSTLLYPHNIRLNKHMFTLALNPFTTCNECAVYKLHNIPITITQLNGKF